MSEEGLSTCNGSLILSGRNEEKYKLTVDHINSGGSDSRRLTEVWARGFRITAWEEMKEALEETLSF